MNDPYFHTGPAQKAGWDGSWGGAECGSQRCERAPCGIAARVSALAPVGLVVAGRDLCLVIAVVTSARRADEVALAHDEELFLNAIADRRERVLSELESVATTDQAQADILRSGRRRMDRPQPGPGAAAPLPATTMSSSSMRADRLIYPAPGGRAPEPAWLDHDPAGPRSARSISCRSRAPDAGLAADQVLAPQSDGRAATAACSFSLNRLGHPRRRCCVASPDRECRRTGGGGTARPVGQIHR